MKKSILAACAVGLMTMLASAELYNIQLNGWDTLTYSGAAYVGSAGDAWNNPVWTGIAGSTTLFSGVTMLDSTGADNGVTATMTALYNNNTTDWNDGGVFNRYTSQSGGAANPLGLIDRVVKIDYSSENGGINDLALVLSGLPANVPVSAYVYGSGNGDGQGATWAFGSLNGGGVATTVTDTTANPTCRDVTLASSQGYGWNRINGVTDSSGNLYIGTTAGPGAVWWQSYLNGVQIDVVPEPASIGLISLAGAGILIFRRLRI